MEIERPRVNPEQPTEERRQDNYEPQVRDLMTIDLFTLLEHDNLNVLEELMKWKRIRHVPVVNTEHELVGLVTHRDFLKAAVSRLAEVDKGEISAIYRDIPISQIMNHNVVTVAPETRLASAAELMISNKYGCLPVVENGKLVGIITEADFMKAFYEWDVSFTH